eukprot:gnl/TRDRNA2_/TRDRNA2_170263_c1_seq2.p1 gnl/TRDRNA2_/TRDRNA2_170263_c1~~gnl/TRDRNA2_/TRDRNA2_170263_c1_seq2.p1  ORF type:complete len:327 (-),score=48.15 gnl/TRDRNA2_/TRDRNA2_170263_c1_seq2:141-1052(-)
MDFVDVVQSYIEMNEKTVRASRRNILRFFDGFEFGLRGEGNLLRMAVQLATYGPIAAASGYVLPMTCKTLCRAKDSKPGLLYLINPCTQNEPSSIIMGFLNGNRQLNLSDRRLGRYSVELLFQGDGLQRFDRMPITRISPESGLPPSFDSLSFLELHRHCQRRGIQCQGVSRRGMMKRIAEHRWVRGGGAGRALKRWTELSRYLTDNYDFHGELSVPPPPFVPEHSDEELQELDYDEKMSDPLYNAEFTLKIGGAVLTGVIVDIAIGLRSQDLLYRVRYSDGDVQDFTANELRALRPCSRGAR